MDDDPDRPTSGPQATSKATGRLTAWAKTLVAAMVAMVAASLMAEADLASMLTEHASEIGLPISKIDAALDVMAAMATYAWVMHSEAKTATGAMLGAALSSLQVGLAAFVTASLTSAIAIAILANAGVLPDDLVAKAADGLRDIGVVSGLVGMGACLSIQANASNIANLARPSQPTGEPKQP